jgi:hypothetical protein
MDIRKVTWGITVGRTREEYEDDYVWDVTLCSLVCTEISKRKKLRFLRKVGTNESDFKASHPRR